MIPFWIVSGAFLLTDFFVLGITYPWRTIVAAVFGIFTTADIYRDLNSPLWYFTLILFYYLLFPLLFSKKRPWATALALLALSGSILYIKPVFLSGVIGLYLVHWIAFPLGILAAWLRTDARVVGSSFIRVVQNTLTVWYVRYSIVVLLLYLIAYTAIHSGIGSTGLTQQTTSLTTMTAFLLLFAIKKIEFRSFYLFGFYSYELYLLHWPIMYRYDLLYTNVPSWLATVLYLALFIALAWVVRLLSGWVSKRVDNIGMSTVPVPQSAR
jgi:peptidoglycan/LPS O-acetylase OafA/YrhL